MMNDQEVLRRPFNIETHKKTFINYLEVIVSEDGTVMYAVPSHQEKLIAMACRKLGVDRDELARRCPQQYYGDYMVWLCETSGCVALWNEFMEGKANEKQLEVIDLLRNEGLYRGVIKVGKD